MQVNPIISAPAADPWMIQHEGFYYYCESRSCHSIFVRKSRGILEIGHDPGTKVWSAPVSGPNSQSVWAPELHFLNGRWYIYYAADNGRNENHRMWVLESETADPLGAYCCRGMIQTDGWAIDGTVLVTEKKELFFLWSGWPTGQNGQQNLYIAPMKNAFTLAAERTLLTEPQHDWECVEMAICEGPQVLQRDGKVFVVYSASGSWTEDYCLGMLVNDSGDYLNARAWKKIGPVFHKNQYQWGVGHCSFVKSPCQNEDWIVYHAKTEKKKGWLDRRVHAQQFNWHPNGLPDFGTPRGTVRPDSFAPLLNNLTRQEPVREMVTA